MNAYHHGELVHHTLKIDHVYMHTNIPVTYLLPDYGHTRSYVSNCNPPHQTLYLTPHSTCYLGKVRMCAYENIVEKYVKLEF